jgi:hypothetical protein
MALYIFTLWTTQILLLRNLRRCGARALLRCVKQVDSDKVPLEHERSASSMRIQILLQQVEE